jgi:hypothetical protein
MLETRVRLPPRPGVSQPIRPDPVGQRARHTRASGLLGRRRCGGFSGPCGWPGDVVLRPTPGDRPSCGAGTVDPTRTGLAGLHGDLDRHDLSGAILHRGRPAYAGIAARARGPWLLPRALAGARITPLGGARVPWTSGAPGTEPIHAVRTRAGAQPGRVEGARLDERRGGPQPVTCERLLAGGRGRPSADGSSRGLHRRHEGGRLVRAGRGHLDGIPSPRRRRLVAVPGLHVIGRPAQPPRRWHPCGGRPPTPAPRRQRAWLAPYPAPRLDGRPRTPPCGRVGGGAIGPQGIASGAHAWRLGVTGCWPRGPGVIRHTPPIARLPRGLAVRGEPRRGADGQTVAGMASGFPDPREALDGTHARQSRRGVGALASPSVEPRARAAALQEGVAPALFGGPYDHTGAHLAADRAVEARGSALSAQGLLPVQTAAHGRGRLALCEIFDGWPDGHPRQPPRGCGRVSAWREQGGDIVSGDARAQLITPHEGPVPTRNGGPGDACRRLGDGWDRWRRS